MTVQNGETEAHGQGRWLRLRVGLMAAAVVAMVLVPEPGTAGRYAWSLPEQIPGSSGGSSPLATADSQGVVTAVWPRGLGMVPAFISASQRAPGGGWTDAARVGDIEAYPLALDVGRNDEVTLLVWKDSGLYALSLAPGASWSAPQFVGPAPTLCSGLRAHLDADGPQPIVAWNGTAACTAAPSRVLTSVRGDDGSWSEPMTVSAPDRPASLGDLEVQRDGTATLVWVRRPASVTESSVWLRERRPDGSWTRRERLSRNGARSPDLSVAESSSSQPGVAYAMVGWLKYVRPGVYLPHAAERSDGQWHYQLLDDRDSDSVEVSADAGEGPLAAWDANGVWARRAGARSGRIQQVSPLSAGRVVFSGRRLFWSGSLGGGGLLMEREWLGPDWGPAHAISSSHLYGGFSVAGGCAVFDVFDATTYEHSIAASCLGEDLTWEPPI